MHLALLLLLALTAGIYSRTLGYDFVLVDDDFLVVKNPEIQNGLSAPAVQRAFTTARYGNWHPLTWLSYMLDRELYGTWAGGYHATNVALHVAATLAAWLALARLSGARWRALYAAALFALHPLHVESVAWVSERKDVLSGLFFWLALWAHAGYARERSSWRWAQVMGFGALGLMSKSMLVTLPFVLLLLDYWPLGRLRGAEQGAAAGIAWRRLPALCAEKLPLFAMAVAASWLALLGQRAAGAVVPIEALPLVLRLANATQAYVGYVWGALWPAGLAAYYPHAGVGVSIPLGLAAGALVAVVTGLVVAAARRFPYLAVGWLWYLGMLVPVIGLVQIGAQSMADRYTYLPLSGLFVAAVWGLAELARVRGRERALAWAGAAWIAALALVSFTQVAHWKDSIALFERALAVTSNNEVIHYQYGVALFELGDLEGAVVELERAVLLNPAHAHAHATLGRVRLEQRRPEQAEEQFRAALELRPRDPELHFQLGSLLARRRADDEAVGHLREALLANPTFAEARLRLARALLRLGRSDEARVELWTLLQADPANRKASRMLRQLGRGAQAGQP